MTARRSLVLLCLAWTALLLCVPPARASCGPEATGALGDVSLAPRWAVL